MKKLLIKLIKVLGSCALVGLLVLFLDIQCIFKKFSGIPCLGCGTTRACISFLQGDVVGSFYWHPLFWLTIILLLMFVFNRGEFFKNDKVNSFFWRFLFLMYLSVYIVRMLMLFPDTPPMDFDNQSIIANIYNSLINTIGL